MVSGLILELRRGCLGRCPTQGTRQVERIPLGVLLEHEGCSEMEFAATALSWLSSEHQFQRMVLEDSCSIPQVLVSLRL